MNIRYTKSGAWMAGPQSCEIDTESLDDAERRFAESSVELIFAAGLKETPGMMDANVHEVLIVETGQVLRADSFSIPERFMAFFVWLQSRAK